MKKFMTFVCVMLFIFLMTSCGDKKKTNNNVPDPEVTDEDVVDDDLTDTDTPDDSDTDSHDDQDTTPENPDTTPDDGDSDTNDSDTDSGIVDDTDTDTPNEDKDNEPVDEDIPEPDQDTDTTEPEEDTDIIPDEEVDTGSCTYIPNAFVSNWTNNFPTDWVSKYDPTGAITPNGKKNFIAYEKIDRGEGNYALRAHIEAPADNLYAFELPPFVPAADAAFPTKLTFDLKASSTSKISINLRCGDTGTTSDTEYKRYNWDQESKSFVNAGNNAYSFVN